MYLKPPQTQVRINVLGEKTYIVDKGLIPFLNESFLKIVIFV